MALGQPVRRADDTARRARLAVAVLFLANGFAFANIVPWLPTIKTELALSNTELGTAIGAMPLGALVTGMLAGPLIARFGSGRVAVGSGLVLAGVVPLVAAAPAWWTLALALFCVGWMDAWMDSAMNAHGLRVQRRYGRTIINTFHGLWSVAAVAGGLAGSAMAGWGAPRLAHIAVVTAVLLAGLIAIVRLLLPGPEADEPAAAEPAHPVATTQPVTAGPGSSHPESEPGSETGPVAGRGWRARLRIPARSLGMLAVLSVLLMSAGAIEDSAASWGAVFMRDELAAPLFLVGLPFVACQGMMTIGRLTGDRVTDRFGAVAVARAGALLSAAGMALALLAAAPIAAIAGFGLMGLGVATLFPLALAAAGEIPGLRGGHGVALAAWLARLGFLGVPPLIGVIADAVSLTTGLWLIPIAGLLAAVLAAGLRPARAAKAAR
ncbi:MFS transporter [Streptomonospora sediminis]